jgi:hypothetical protein
MGMKEGKNEGGLKKQLQVGSVVLLLISVGCACAFWLATAETSTFQRFALAHNLVTPLAFPFPCHCDAQKSTIPATRLHVYTIILTYAVVCGTNITLFFILYVHCSVVCSYWLCAGDNRPETASAVHVCYRALTPSCRICRHGKFPLS